MAKVEQRGRKYGRFLEAQVLRIITVKYRTADADRVIYCRLQKAQIIMTEAAKWEQMFSICEVLSFERRRRTSK